MAIRSCNTDAAYIGLVGFYVGRCGSYTATAAQSFQLTTNVDQQEYTANNRTRTVSTITNYSATATVGFSLQSLASLFGGELHDLTHSSGVLGTGYVLPQGILPRDVTFTAITRSQDGKELHIHGTQSSISSVSFNEISSGNVLSTTFSLNPEEAEIIEWDEPVQAYESEFMTPYRPYHAYFVCDCDTGDSAASSLLDGINGGTLTLAGSTMSVINRFGCCGIVFGSTNSFSGTGAAISGTDWGIVAQVVVTQSATVFDGGNVTISWSSVTDTLTVANTTSTVDVPFSGGELTVGYSTDGTLIVNGLIVDGLDAEAVSLGAFTGLSSTDEAVLYGLYLFDRAINTSDVI